MIVTDVTDGSRSSTGKPNDSRAGPAEARGQPLGAVFRIVNEDTRQTVENPVEKALRLGATVGLANHTC